MQNNDTTEYQMIHTQTVPELWQTLCHAQKEYANSIIDRHELTYTIEEIINTCDFLTSIPDTWRKRIIARLNKLALRKQLSWVTM